MKKFSLVLLVALLSVALLGAAAQAKVAKDDMGTAPKVPAKVSVYALNASYADGSSSSLGTAEVSKDAGRASLGANVTSASPGFTLWTSKRDMQDNSSSTRRAGHRKYPYVHFTGMFQPTTNLSTGRAYRYNMYDPSAAGGAWSFTAGSGTSIQIAGEKGGFCGLDVDSSGAAWLFGHTDIPIIDEPETRPYRETGGPGAGFWVQDPVADALAESVSVGTNIQMIWPKGDMQILPGNVRVFHMVVYQSGDPVEDAAIAYYRSQTNDFTQAAPLVWTAAIMDTAFNGVTPNLAASQASQKVAVVWTKPTAENLTQGKNQVDVDVVYRVSTDAGLTWGPKVNITNYAPNVDGFRAYAEVSCLYTSDDKLHILWPGREWPADAYTNGIPTMRCRLFHWTETFAAVITTVTAAQWDQTICLAGDWQMNVAKVNLSECSGKLYAMWVQFGNVQGSDTVLNDCASGQNDVGSQANGDIWMSVASDLNGLTWDRRRNLTNSKTVGCDSLTGSGIVCDADGWPSAARYEYDESDMGGGLTFPATAKALNAGFGYSGDEYIHLTYVNDKFPGNMGGDPGEGVFTDNPFKWVMVPCVAPVPNPELAVSPSLIEFPDFIKHGTQMVQTVTMENLGNVTCNVTAITLNQTAGPGTWMNFNTAALSIPAGIGNSTTRTLTLNPGGAINSPGTIVNLKGYIEFTSNTPIPLDKIRLNIDINVADTVVGAKYDTLFTTCTRLVVRNDGNFGNDADGTVNLDYWYNGDCDTLDSIPGFTNRYLYSGTPVVITGTSAAAITNSSWAGFSGTFVSDNGMKAVVDAVSPVFAFSSFTGTGYTAQRSGQWVTSDSAIAGEREIYAPTASDSCNFMIVQTRLFPNPKEPGAKANLTILEMIDWDVPSDTSTLNEVAFDQPKQTIFQRGVELTAKNALECQPAGTNDNNRRFGGMRFLSQCMAKNINGQPELALWARDISDFQDASGVLVDDSLWTAGQFTAYDVPGSPTQADWFSAANIKKGFTLPANDTLIYTFAIGSQLNGTQAQFLTIMDKAKAWYIGHLAGTPGFCSASCCQGTRGNADGDLGDGCDISDLQVYIDYLFFGGAPAACMDEFDTAGGDASVDISDLQAVIDYLFFGSSLPGC